MAFFLAVLYFILVASSVFNAVTVKEAQSKIANMRSELSVLESKYVAFDNKINRNLAKDLGFHDVLGNTFASSQNSVSRLNN